jgi:hypothetical protein
MEAAIGTFLKPCLSAKPCRADKPQALVNKKLRPEWQTVKERRKPPYGVLSGFGVVHVDNTLWIIRCHKKQNESK